MARPMIFVRKNYHWLVKLADKTAAKHAAVVED
jgi:hypothetical protein